MNTRIMQIRALDKKTSSLSDAKNIVPKGTSWINTVREAIGMTTIQLAKRLGVNQSRISKMEVNEANLKLCTMKKVAEEILLGVNLNMALENQAISKSQKL